MSKGASKVQVQGGPQLSSVICGAADDMVSAKLNLNCPLGIFLSYALQSLKVELDNKVSDINDQADQVMPIVPLDTAEDQLEEVTNTAKDAAAAKKEQLHELGRKLREMGTKIASSTAHYIDLLDENNVIMQCQEVCWILRVMYEH